MNRSEIVERIWLSESDVAARQAREACAAPSALHSAMQARRCGGTGDLLGTDRREGRSPFGFGDDAVVGLATVVQIAGELSSGAVSLLEQGNLYGAAALVRQLVEVEYLAWAFAEDEEEAASWLRSDRDERIARWQPRHLRDRSAGRFRGSDYAGHCEEGGHPTPLARGILPHHTHPLPPYLWWCEVVTHGVSAWEYTVVAAKRFQYDELVETAGEAHGLSDAIRNWRAVDRYSREMTLEIRKATRQA